MSKLHNKGFLGLIEIEPEEGLFLTPEEKEAQEREMKVIMKAYFTSGVMPIVNSPSDMALAFRYFEMQNEWFTIVPAMIVRGRINWHKNIAKRKKEQGNLLKVVK